MADKGKVLDFLKKVVGMPAYEMGGASGTQCVELVGKYVSTYFGGRKTGNGDGRKVATNIAKSLPKQFKLVPYNSNIKLQVGDIISYESGSSPENGHTAICIKAGNPYTIAEQWKGSKTVRSNTKKVAKGKRGVSYTIVNVARPIFSEGKSTFEIKVNTKKGGPLNYRDKPNGKILGTIPNGTKKTIISTSGDWYQTKHKHWIAKTLCKKL